MKFKELKLKDLGEIITGKTPNKKNPEYYNSKDVMFIKPDDLSQENILLIKKSNEYISKKGAEKVRLLPENSVLVTCIGIIGKVAILKHDGAAFNQQINAIIPNEKIITPKFLAYSICFNRRKLRDTANAPIVPIVNKTQFGEFKIKVSDMDYQIKVVHIIDKAQELIDKRKAQIEALDQLAQSVFLEMFSSNQKGKVPLSELCEINPPKKEVNHLKEDTVVSFIPMANVSETGKINLSETRKLSEVYKGFTYFKENDILFAKITPCMENGKGAIAKNLINGLGFGSTEFHVLRPNEGITSEWLYYLTTLPKFRMQAEKNMTGSAGQKRVPKQFFDKYKVSRPSIEAQMKFKKIVIEIDRQKESLEKNLSELQNLFNSLMQRAFKGELFAAEEVSNL